MKRTIGFLATATILGVIGCTGADEPIASEESNLDEMSAPRKGSTIRSPSVSPSKMYWGARSINLLTTVGYLTAAEAAVAKRADGIIANNPRNDRIGVDELAALESPEHIDTLFPEERAVIPKLWKILEIEGAPDVRAPSPGLTKTVVSAYTVQETHLPVAQSGAQRTAERIQLTKNGDGNAATISGADVEKAYAERESYLPEEVAQFRTIVTNIAASGSPAVLRLPADSQRLELPGAQSKVLLEEAPVKLWVDMTPTFANAWDPARPTEPVSLSLTSGLRVTNDDTGTVTVIVLNSTTGADAAAAKDTKVAAKSRVEIWKAGSRIAQFEAVPADPTQAVEQIPFGYSVKLGDKLYDMDFTSGRGAYREGVSARPTAPSGAYYVSGQPGSRLDVFANGRALFTSGGQTRDCYPTSVRGSGVTACRVLDAAGAVHAQFNYAPPAAPSDSPAIITAKIAGADAVLYPY